jgi:ketosteroid isomerase-like protein
MKTLAHILALIMLVSCIDIKINTEKESNKDIAIKFIEAINNHNVDEIVDLMSEDHLFIDAYGDKYIGKKGMKEGWQRYYELFPDYRVEISEIIESDSLIGLFGYASGTYKNIKDESNSNFWKTSASWKSVVKNKKIKHWQIYCDYSKLSKIIDKNNLE